jgi:antitoxin HigA-1
MVDFKLKNPCHVGEFVREEIIAPFGLSVTDAAKILGVSRPTLSNFLNEKASLSPEMAIRVQKAFGVSFETLMRMQNEYDIAKAHEVCTFIDVKLYKAV